MINPIERITQNRIIQLFQKELGYIYYGNWSDSDRACPVATNNSATNNSATTYSTVKNIYSEV